MPNLTCVRDKLDWLDRHVGEGWSSRAIITTDKTRIRGDVLIDDKPTITGEFTPEWVHVLFDQPYNQHITDKARLTDWADWEHIING